MNNAGVAPDVRADTARSQRGELRPAHRHQPQGPVFPDPTRRRADDATARRCRITRAPWSTSRSISAFTASINRGDYCVAKAGLAMMTKLYAARLAGERHQRVRNPARRHRHGHDRRGEGKVRQAFRRRPDADQPLGPAVRHGQAPSPPLRWAIFLTARGRSSRWTAASICTLDEASAERKAHFFLLSFAHSHISMIKSAPISSPPT